MNDIPAYRRSRRTRVSLEVKRVNRYGVTYLALARKGASPFVSNLQAARQIVLKPEDCVVDLGAYVGEYSLYAAQAGCRSIVAYEPGPDAFPLLQRNLKHVPGAEAVRAAVVGNQRKEVDLFVSFGLGVRNTIVARPRSKKPMIRVPAVAYADAVAGATVIKMDVEGAEYEYPILDCLDDVRAVVIEFHYVKKDWLRYARHIADGLEAVGFEAVVAPTWRGLFSCHGTWAKA